MASVGPTPEQVDEFVRLYKDGWLVQEIAAKAYWSPTTVSRHLKLRGITVQRFRWGNMRLSLQTRDETREWYRAGVPVEEIARRHGVKPIAIYERLARMREPRNQNQNRPTCKHGHLWTPETTIHTGGKRMCRSCNRDAQRRYRARQAAKAQPHDHSR
jgi:hypothetical protein